MKSGRFRTALVIISCIFLQPIGKLVWAEQSASVTISVLRDLVDILKISGEAIANIGDGFAHIANLVESGYDKVEARQTQARLRDIYARLVVVSRVTNAGIVYSLDDYVSMYNNYSPMRESWMEESWRRTMNNISQTLPEIRALLDDVKAERSDFITEQAYLELIEALSSRENILQNIAVLPQPQTDEEIELIRQIAEEYRILAENLQNTLNSISEYLRNH